MYLDPDLDDILLPYCYREFIFFYHFEGLADFVEDENIEVLTMVFTIDGTGTSSDTK